MAESIFSYALTTVARVKTRLSIDSAGFDTLLMYLINSVTDMIESECNTWFKETIHSNQIYSVENGFLLLKQSPVSEVTSIQYRAGIKSNPVWTEFYPDDWELLGNGATGIIQLRGSASRGMNNVRVTYTAGYKINFANYRDHTTHTLPADITDLAERMVVKLFKRREAEGKQREDFNGGSVIWKEILSPEDEMTLARYRRTNFL